MIVNACFANYGDRGTFLSWITLPGWVKWSRNTLNDSATFSAAMERWSCKRLSLHYSSPHLWFSFISAKFNTIGCEVFWNTSFRSLINIGKNYRTAYSLDYSSKKKHCKLLWIIKTAHCSDLILWQKLSSWVENGKLLPVWSSSCSSLRQQREVKVSFLFR